MNATLTITARQRSQVLPDGQSQQLPPLEVVDPTGGSTPSFRLMCVAITDDIQSAEGSGADVLEVIRRIEHGEIAHAELDGNAWVAHITKDKVWFESLYNQASEGEVEFELYKRTVEVYVDFLKNRGHKAISENFAPRA